MGGSGFQEEKVLGLSLEDWRKFEPLRLVGRNGLSTGEEAGKLQGRGLERESFPVAATKELKGGGHER